MWCSWTDTRPLRFPNSMTVGTKAYKRCCETLMSVPISSHSSTNGPLCIFGARRHHSAKLTHRNTRRQLPYVAMQEGLMSNRPIKHNIVSTTINSNISLNVRQRTCSLQENTAVNRHVSCIQFVVRDCYPIKNATTCNGHGFPTPYLGPSLKENHAIHKKPCHAGDISSSPFLRPITHHNHPQDSTSHGSSSPRI